MRCIRPVRFVEGERRLVVPAWQIRDLVTLLAW